MEYEYSFKVKALKPYIDYCLNNGFELKKDVEQTGKEFKSVNKTLARIKIDVNKQGETKKFIDFKDEDDSEKLLKERRETFELEFQDDKAMYSILEFLGYEYDCSYTRRRSVYEKNNVKFEFDYYYDTKNKILGVEGDKEEVDKVYEDIKSIAIENGDLKF